MIKAVTLWPLNSDKTLERIFQGFLHSWLAKEIGVRKMKELGSKLKRGTSYALDGDKATSF